MPVESTSRSTVTSTAERIEKMIREGDFNSIGRLPGERDLVQRLHVSRTTLRSALALLANQGVVSSTPQSGWFVTEAPLGEPPRTLISFTEMARRRGVIAASRVLYRAVREATLDEAQALMAAPLSLVLDVERLRSLRSTPICIDHSIVLLSKTPGLEQIELENRSLYEEMQELGTRPARSDFVIEAVGADDREAALLEVTVGSPLLLGTETCFDSVGTALLIGTTRYRANAYRYYSTMVRP
ncbi:GntR family transcriptional regulator [Cryobacterium sp. TMT2-4]|uniref:GntR family transcriptional regulator n=1 Tax=Cryobacterium sp. TMT2-4 TaxID=1259254 RepID=UPI00106DADA5|nr:GntR family transcriptional regulator [Cryobacterium sp. TMT2-4]TFC70535.1 GntR family transcriptional regulator [Cryobacterium sp. TMT2-4]